MKVRVRFSKQGMMKFIGHLDIVRYFQKVNRRAGVDVAYSEGFSPHQKMSFASPLSVGFLSRGEYFDMEVHSTKSSREMIGLMNAQNVEGIKVLSFKLLGETDKNCMSIVAAADYLIFTKDFDEQILNDFMEQSEINVLKKTKKSEKQINIRPMIYELKKEEDGIFMKVAQGSAENLKPDLVIKSLYERCNKDLPQGIVYERLDLYCKIDHELISLGLIGEDIN